MRTFSEVSKVPVQPVGELTLSFDQRCKSRLRARLQSGEEVALLLPRGMVLREGALLRSEDGTVIRVRAAAELVTTARTGDSQVFAQACYHLGNRHVALQIAENWLRFLHDHVLAEMVAGLGLEVVSETAPFEPEPGAYQGGQGHHHDLQQGHHD